MPGVQNNIFFFTLFYNKEQIQKICDLKLRLQKKKEG